MVFYKLSILAFNLERIETNELDSDSHIYYGSDEIRLMMGMILAKERN